MKKWSWDKIKVANKTMERIRPHRKGFKAAAGMNSWSMPPISSKQWNNETWLHVLQCPAETSRPQWELALNELEEILIELRTNPQIIIAWKLRLFGWYDQQQFLFRPFTLDMKVYSALQEQDLINWTNFLMGRMSKKWEDAQDKWIVMTSTKWKRSSQRWFTQALLAIW